MNEVGESWSDDGKEERREVESTLALWRDAAGRSGLPRLADIQLRYDGDGWEHRFLLIEDPDPLCSVFILCGASVREGFGGPVVGRSLEEAVPPGAQELIDACYLALRDQVPVRATGSFPAPGGERTIYHAIFLPLRGEARSPRYVLGTFGWRREPMIEGPGC